MKSGRKTKSHNPAGHKTHAGRRGNKNKASDRKSFKGVNRDNTLANWVAGMESTKSRTNHRGNALANCVLNASQTEPHRR